MAKKFGARKYGNKSVGKTKRHADEDTAPRGKSRGRGRGKQDDAEFIHLTGLFESKSGNSYTVFIKADMLEKFQDLEENDLLGVSNAKHGGMSLWVKKAEE